MIWFLTDGFIPSPQFSFLNADSLPLFSEETIWSSIFLVDLLVHVIKGADQNKVSTPNNCNSIQTNWFRLETTSCEGAAAETVSEPYWFISLQVKKEQNCCFWIHRLLQWNSESLCRNVVLMEPLWEEHYSSTFTQDGLKLGRCCSEESGTSLVFLQSITWFLG